MNAQTGDKSEMSAYTMRNDEKGRVLNGNVDMCKAVALTGDLRQDGTEPEDHPAQEML